MKELKKYTWISALITLAAGTLLHFAYEFSGYNSLVGMFTPVNESTWEHLKLLLTPVFLAGIAEWIIYGKNLSNFFPALFISAAAGMFAITASFYTYTGIIGRNFMAADIMTFVLGVFVTYFLRYLIIKSGRFSSGKWTFIALALFVLLFVFTAYASFEPPHIDIFKNPLDGSYGIRSLGTLSSSVSVLTASAFAFLTPIL